MNKISIQFTLNNQTENCLFRSINSVNQNPRVDDSQLFRNHVRGTLASKILSKAFCNSSFIIIVPSIASNNSDNVMRVNFKTYRLNKRKKKEN